MLTSRTALAGLITALCTAQALPAATVVNSTWLGGDYDLYSDATYWSPPEVPNNSAEKTYNVTVPLDLGVHINATVSNLTIGATFGVGLGSDYSVTGATVINADPATPDKPALSIGGNFTTGSLNTYSDGVLEGIYDIFGTLKFNGADVRKLRNAQVTLTDSGAHIVNEFGADALRNLSVIDSASQLSLPSSFLTAGDFTNDGVLQLNSGDFVVTGQLTNFDSASRTLRNGTFTLPDGTSLHFAGADIVSNGGLLTLTRSAKIVDQSGSDALRNISSNLPGGGLILSRRDFATAGDFRNDGTIGADLGIFTVTGTLANYDARSKTLRGGAYQIISNPWTKARIVVSGADVVHNAASISLVGQLAKLVDEKGSDALRNFVDNQPGGSFTLTAPDFSGDDADWNTRFTAVSDFVNAGTVTVIGDGPESTCTFALPIGHSYRQTAGLTLLVDGVLGAKTVIDAGELAADGTGPGLESTIQGDVTIGNATLKATKLFVQGSVHLSNSSTFYYVHTGAHEFTISGELTLAGTLKVEYPDRFPPGNYYTFLVARSHYPVTGTFSNVAFGSRITTTDGAGSFVLNLTASDTRPAGSEITLTDYQRAIPSAQLLNISARAQVLTGDNVAIGGFYVSGRDPKKVIIRAIGPSLARAGVDGALQDPTLELHNAQSTIASNDNWGDSQSAEVISSGVAPTDSREAAIVATLQPGAYTAIVRGKNNDTGIALVEIYDLSTDAQSKLANISTRAFVDADHVLIGGFIAGKQQGEAELVVRAMNVDLGGIKDILPDPALEVRDRNGALVAANDDFESPRANLDTMPSDLWPPTYYSAPPDINRYEAATGVKLPPGNYTVIVHGKNGASGNVLVEVFDLLHG
jgi:hypothetical protein